MMISAVQPVKATEFLLTIETSPSEVLAIDSEAVTGGGYHESGTCVIIDAKQTIISGNIRYEFLEWDGDEPWPFDPDDEPVLTGNQAFVMMDADRTVTAIYEKIIDVSWEQSYSDDTRGTELKISVDDKYFQFVTPQKTFDVTKADVMILKGELLTILHSDSDLYLAATVIIDPRIDFCSTIARDRHTGQTYILRDKIGVE